MAAGTITNDQSIPIGMAVSMAICVTIRHARSIRLALCVNLLAANVLVARHVDARVSGEEVRWTKHDGVDLRRPERIVSIRRLWLLCSSLRNLHDRPILHSGVVCQGKHRPKHDIFILNVVASVHGILHATELFRGLVGVLASSVQLLILVLCDPHVMLSKVGTFGLDRPLVGQQQLCRRRDDLVRHRLATDRVDLRRVGNLEDAVCEWVSVGPGRLSDWRLDNLVQVAVRVRLCVHWDWQ